MNRQEIIDEIVTEISKEKNIPEHEVGTYDVTLRLADRLVNLLNIPVVMPSVVYLVTNEDKMTVESAHYQLKDARKEVDDWALNKPQDQFMAVEIEIH